MNYSKFWNQINIFIKPAIDTLQFIKTITAKKIINSFLLRLSYYVSKYLNTYIHWGYPESISIEPTNTCNLNCPECPSGNNTANRQKLFMSLDNYKTNINQIKDYTSHLQLFFQGEPFIHPDIYDMISYATSKNIYTSTSTNGHFLSTDNCTKIINSKLHRIIISIDGTTQESYEKYRVGGDLNRVKSGISNLVNEKKRLKSRTPFIIMQFIVFKNNEHQINDIKQLAKQLNVDAIKIKTAQIYNFKFGNELIPTNEEFSRYKKEGNTYVLNKKKNYKCKRVWFGLVISADNNLLPCCFDKDAKYSFNNDYINETNTITDNWHNKKLMKFRKLVWNNNNTIDICQNCTEGINQKN